MGQFTTAQAWGQYARQQLSTMRMEGRSSNATHGEAALDLILDRIERGRPVHDDEVARRRRTADRCERSRTAIVLRFARSVEDDMRHPGPTDPETAAALALALAREAPGDATVVALHAQGHSSEEIAVRVGMRAEAVRQRLSRRAKASLAA